MDGGSFGRALEATLMAVALISAVVGWCVIEGLIWLVKFLWSHLHWVSMVAILCSACNAADGSACAGGNWPKPTACVAVVEPEPEYDESVEGTASERIPPLTLRGTTNNRFQLPPGPFDVVIHYWQKWHVGKWLMTKAVPFLEKYLPVLARWEQNYEKARNAVIIATPIVLKVLKKF